MTTCEWPTTPLYQDYHDYEWGRPIHDDQHQFEHLCLESLQCGLSWLTILNKRNIIRECFDHFDIDFKYDRKIKEVLFIHSNQKNSNEKEDQNQKKMVLVVSNKKKERTVLMTILQPMLTLA